MINAIRAALLKRKITSLTRSAADNETRAERLEAAMRVADRKPWWVVEEAAKFKGRAAADRAELAMLERQA